jgi:hypothetical protein
MTNITQKQLDDFKSLHTGNQSIQALTLTDVIANTTGKVADWNSLEFPSPKEAAAAAGVSIPRIEVGLEQVGRDWMPHGANRSYQGRPDLHEQLGVGGRF